MQTKSSLIKWIATINVEQRIQIWLDNIYLIFIIDRVSDSIPCKPLLKIYGKNVPFLPHAIPSVLFNKCRTETLVWDRHNRQTDRHRQQGQIRHTQQTDNRYATDHKPQKWKTQGEGCRIPAWLASGLTIPRGS